MIKAKIVLAVLFGLACVAGGHAEKKMNTAEKSLYGYALKTIDGKAASLKDYAGKALLIVNTASECGYTPQYEGLEALYEKYKDRGLVVLGFPSNDFGAQEPGANAEIQTFCKTRYGVAFPLFEKGPVKGTQAQPLFAALSQAVEPKGEIRWNFEKFLVDRTGTKVQRFRSAVEPGDPNLAAAIEKALR